MNGSACEYCHEPHRRAPVYLSRRQREVLSEMSVARAWALVMPVMWGKLRDLRASTETLLSLEALGLAWLAMASPASWPVYRMEALPSALRGIRLRAMLVVLEYTAWKEMPGIVAAARDLYRRLRDDLSPHNRSL
eukprot:CAMPEP_0176234104 /NCGR_PEP_ID=MMETSP0121_2-20121125/26165_1 /TAXON_ID=160619 /ORGANISM="Kryptoperidinium foliaceum, Strain CCMP 1326" /LENGTH=134 /DNA_ID=CAMNT_0017573513 /DNA_START=60 /DNA_END=464 /DNA_ORIENTATION=-